MGARVEFSQFETGNPEKSPIRGPREFPNLVDELPKLQCNPIFRASWERRRDDFSDARFRRAIVIAPGRSVLGFSIESLQRIRNPVQLFGGHADSVAPPAECCEWLHKNVPGSKLEIISGGVGHYTFLPKGSELGNRVAPQLFRDHSGVERQTIHEYISCFQSNSN